jgi:hypothetical protein
MKKFLILTIALLGFAVVSFGQVVDLTSPNGVTFKIDTVSNTGTAYLTNVNPISVATSQSTVIQVVVTKISGTVGGTISLQGSIDGVNFKALNTAETQTALATITATDASNSYHWRLNGCPFLYYRVSWTGTGTMSASFSAKLLRVK